MSGDEGCLGPEVQQSVGRLRGAERVPLLAGQRGQEERTLPREEPHSRGLVNLSGTYKDGDLWYFYQMLMQIDQNQFYS